MNFKTVAKLLPVVRDKESLGNYLYKEKTIEDQASEAGLLWELLKSTKRKEIAFASLYTLGTSGMIMLAASTYSITKNVGVELDPYISTFLTTCLACYTLPYTLRLVLKRRTEYKVERLRRLLAVRGSRSSFVPEEIKNWDQK